MPIDARLKRMLQDGTISDWLLRDPGGLDDLPTDPVSDAVVRSLLADLVEGVKGTVSNVTTVANSLTSVQLLAPNPDRKAATIFNDAEDAILYVKFGTGAAANSFTIRMEPGGYFEFMQPIYTGEVHGIADVAEGTARITEVS